MKPLTLRMQAFGPYGGQVDVDFERLRSVGLFVVSGPTGAGKTSIFDAMAYALYNELPGERGGFKDIRSDHADPTVLCEVVFEFEAHGDRWRVTRVPTQERAKKRGTGLAKENAKAALDRWVDDDWVPVEATVTAVSVRCSELVGLDSKQFQRVMLLPQGQFQQVLKADSKDRRTLLRTLFRSGLYESIEAELKERAKAAESTLADLARSVGADQEAAAASYREAVAALEAESPAMPDNASLEDIDRIADSLRSGALAATADAQRRFDDEAKVSRDELQQAINQAAQRKRRAELLVKHEALTEASEAMVADQARAEDATQARPIIEQQTLLSRQQRESTDAQAEAGRQADILAEAGARLGFEGELLGPDDLDTARKWATSVERDAQRSIEQLERVSHLRSESADAGRVAAEAVEASAELVRRQRATLDHQEHLQGRKAELVRLAESLPRRETELVAAIAQAQQGAELRHLDTQLAELAVEDESLAAQLLDIEQRAAANATQEAIFDERARQLPDLRSVAEGSRAKVVNRRRLDEAVQQHAEAAERYTSTKDSADAVLRAFEAAAAPRLAKALIADQPCSVCGSPSHPAPALDDGSDHAATDLGTVEASQSKVTAAASAMSEANERQSKFRELLGGDATAPLASLVDAADRADELVADAELAERELKSNRSERDGLDQRLSEIVARRSELADLRTAAEADRARLDGALGNATSRDPEELQAEVRTARQLRDEAAEAGADQAGVAQSVGDVEAALVSIADQLAIEEQRRIEAVKARDLHRVEADDIVATIKGDEEGLRSTLEHVSGFVAGIDRLDRAWRSVAAARVRVDATKAQLQTYLGESVFESLGQAISAGLDVDTTNALRSAVQAWRTDLTSVASALAEIDRVPLPGEPPDIDKLRAWADESASRARDHHDRLARAQLHLEQLATTIERGRTSEAAVRDRQVAAQQVKELADICGGNGPLRRSLESWVLAAHLRDVVELANKHLAPMSSGRYELIVSDATDDRRSQSGLELTVLDARSGKPRPVASLSGGETFQASLALALGLADVVSANRGGVQIDALFVDEGFGSLDAESLDHAIDVLDGLRSRGALVGVITHVEALKRALQVGIEVERHADGSGSVLKQLI